MVTVTFAKLFGALFFFPGHLRATIFGVMHVSFLKIDKEKITSLSVCTEYNQAWQSTYIERTQDAPKMSKTCSSSGLNN